MELRQGLSIQEKLQFLSGWQMYLAIKGAADESLCL